MAGLVEFNHGGSTFRFEETGPRKIMLHVLELPPDDPEKMKIGITPTYADEAFGHIAAVYYHNPNCKIMFSISLEDIFNMLVRAVDATDK